MPEKRLFLLLTFGVVFLLIFVSTALILFNKGGATDFDLFGQKFSSSNIGVGVLFLAVMIVVYSIRESAFEPKSRDSSRNHVYTQSASGDAITWEEFISGINDLVLEVTSAHGFRPDLVVGICGGGLMVADILSKRLGHIPTIAIWANRHSSKAGSAFSGPASKINKIDFDGIFRENAVNRILIVDDVIYSGKTLQEAVEYVRSCSKLVDSGSVEMKTAVLFSLTSATYKADYSIFSHSRSRKMMPSSDRLRR